MMVPWSTRLWNTNMEIRGNEIRGNELLGVEIWILLDGDQGLYWHRLKNLAKEAQ